MAKEFLALDDLGYLMLYNHYNDDGSLSYLTYIHGGVYKQIDTYPGREDEWYNIIDINRMSYSKDSTLVCIQADLLAIQSTTIFCYSSSMELIKMVPQTRGF